MVCLSCKSNRLVMNVRAIDRGDSNLTHDLVLEVNENPDAWIFKGQQTGSLRANVCADCGYVMFALSIEDARKLESAKKASP